MLYYPNKTNNPFVTSLIKGNKIDEVDPKSVKWIKSRFDKGVGGILAKYQVPSYIRFIEGLIIEKAIQPHLIICDTCQSLESFKNNLSPKGCSISLFGKFHFKIQYLIK